MSCRRTPGDRTDIHVNHRHAHTCTDDNCRGCQPCDTPANRHCTVCTTHLEPGQIASCDTCVGDVRRHLVSVVELAALLPAHALDAAHDGLLLASAELPGGDALVMMGRGSQGDGTEQGDVDALPDEDPPAFVLGWWEENWRERLGLDLNTAAPAWQYHRPARTLVEAYRFLDQHHSWAAQHHPGFWAYARDLRILRGRLQELLIAGDDPASGVACFECDTTLIRDYHAPRPCDCGPKPRPTHVRSHADQTLCCLACAAIAKWEFKHETHDQGGLIDPDPNAGWYCPRCGRAYTPGEYQRAIATDYDLVADWRTADDASRLTGAPTGSIRSWASGNQPVVRKRRDASGRVTYNLTDIRDRLAERAADA